MRTVSNQNGYVISRTDHTAYGENIGAGVGLRSTLKGYFDSPDKRQGYGLTERDEATGLDHTWFRKNEGQAGRWTSPDPYLGSMNLADPQSFNRYSYVGGDPVNFVDPSGLLSLVCQLWHQVYVGGPNDGQHVPGSYFWVCYVIDNDWGGPGRLPVSLPNGGVVGDGGGGGISSQAGEQNRANNVMRCTERALETDLADASSTLETIRTNTFNDITSSMTIGGIAGGAAIGVAATSATGPGAIIGGVIGGAVPITIAGIAARNSRANMRNSVGNTVRQFGRSVGNAFRNCLNSANM